MSSLLESLSPSRQNPTQRIGYFVSLAIAALVLLLHYPFEGYKTGFYLERTHLSYLASKACFENQAIDVGQLNMEQMAIRTECNKKLNEESNPKWVELQFSEWVSKAPLFEWFGSIIHAMVFILFALSLGGLWLWVFRNDDDG